MNYNEILKSYTGPAAERIVKHLGITKPDEIDLEAIAWTQGVRVKFKPLVGCEARIVGFGDKAIATINNTGRPQRQRFSIAHELGHWFWHKGKLLVCRVEEHAINSAGPNFEKTANEFASDLLMPTFILDPIIRGRRFFNFNLVDEISEIFRVSRTSAAIRLIKTNNWPCILVNHAGGKRIWFARSKLIPERWFPRNMLAPRSAAFDASVGELAGLNTIQHAPADAWFSIQEAKKYEVSEQTEVSYQHQLLTILTINDIRMLEER